MACYDDFNGVYFTVQALRLYHAEVMDQVEILVVDNHSTDDTSGVVRRLAQKEPRIRLIVHDTNRLYSGSCQTALRESRGRYVAIMDSDGQFDIRDLEPFFPLIGEYDAVLGYRIKRQDTWMRKLNAWGWKILIGMVFGVYVRDVDCAFKLYRGAFFREHRLETR